MAKEEMRDVPKEEMEAARDAIIAHGVTYERSQLEAFRIFEELVRQLRIEIETNPTVKVVLN